MMEWKGFDLEGDALRDSFASRASTLKQAIGGAIAFSKFP